MIKKYLEYIQDNPQRYWFKAKVYGWGWTPATWQGWSIIGVYLLSIFLLTLTLDPTSTPQEVSLIFVLPCIILTSALIRICYRKGEAPRWSWGYPEKNK